VPFACPDLTDAEVGEALAVLRSGWLTTGPRVAEFERRFAAYAGAPFAVAVNSCTAALHLSLMAAGIGHGDEVITTPLTFCATANVIVHAGARPVFADIDPDTWNLDPATVAATITPRTRAVVPVHFAGRPVDVAAFRELAARAGLALVEDAAHCVEGVSGGRKIGAAADFTAFSFYATKNLTTGEGGMVTTASEAAAARMRTAALHGMSRDAWARHATGGSAHYDVVLPGFKYNMTDLQAAIGLHQLARLPAMQARRTSLWQRYDAALADLPVTRPAPVDPRDVHARHLYTILVDPARCGWTRDAVLAELKRRGVHASIHFRAVHLHSYYRERFGLARGMFPHAELASDQILSLPFSSAMPERDVDIVAETLHDLLGAGRASLGAA
jgi:dTDP-4-amino-4,6-dideoxygalactose transaminase